MNHAVSPATQHILVLDDEPAVLGLVTAALNHAGYSQVRTSSSIAGARQCWHAQVGNFDLLLSDFCLPDGWAPELIQDLLRHKPNLRIIIMSGFAEDDLGLDGNWARQVKVLLKPFHPEELVRAVESSLGQPAAN